MPDHSIAFQTLLGEVLREPGFISKAYSAFHNYSIGNQIAAALQCFARGLDIGPIASFMGWKEKGRYVRKGEKGIVLCMPLTMKGQRIDDETGEIEEYAFQRFVWRPHWFVVGQTEGAQLAETGAVSPFWDRQQALEALQISEHRFAMLGGNVQGYASGRTIAVNPVAEYPHKTTFHEIAHIVLGHTAENMTLIDSERTPRDIREVEAESVAYILTSILGMSGREASRGYVQAWAQGLPISEKSAQRIFAAADRILKAGSIARVIANKVERNRPAVYTIQAQ